MTAARCAECGGETQSDGRRAPAIVHEIGCPEAAPDAPSSEDDRFAIYSAADGPRVWAQRRIAETSLDGIGLTLSTLRDEGEIGRDSRVGILDRQTREWLVNPYARGDLR